MDLESRNCVGSEKAWKLVFIGQKKRVGNCGCPLRVQDSRARRGPTGPQLRGITNLQSSRLPQLVRVGLLGKGASDWDSGRPSQFKVFNTSPNFFFQVKVTCMIAWYLHVLALWRGN